MKRAMLLACALLTACAVQAPSPVSIRVGEDACAFCRMTLVSVSTAAQIITPGEEPVIFDELGCLQQYIAANVIAETATVFVADHWTGEWVNAADAVFTRTETHTPMSSGLLAHADAASRDADRAAAGGTRVGAELVIGPTRRSDAR